MHECATACVCDCASFFFNFSTIKSVIHMCTRVLKHFHTCILSCLHKMRTHTHAYMCALQVCCAYLHGLYMAKCIYACSTWHLNVLLLLLLLLLFLFFNWGIQNFVQQKTANKKHLLLLLELTVLLSMTFQYIFFIFCCCFNNIHTY